MSNKMELTKNGLENRQAWESAGYILPKFDREEVVKKRKSILDTFWRRQYIPCISG